jgi:hypothetical protein
MAFASYMLYLGLSELSFINPQAALNLSICLFVVLCVFDMLITDKSDLHLEEE